MKKSSKKEKDSLLGKIRFFWQIKSVRATLFFGFYFFFFLFLFFNLDLDSLNNGKNNSSNNQNNETQVGNQDNSLNNNINNQNNNSIWNFNTLIKEKYQYNYTIDENGSNLEFNGHVSEYNPLINNYQYNYFLNLYNINQITKNSKYISKEFFHDDYQFNYEISNKKLGELLESNNVLSRDKLNTITIYTNSNMVINKIELELISLMQELNGYSNYKIVLNYEKNK